MTDPATRYRKRFETASLEPIFGDIEMPDYREGLPLPMGAEPAGVSIEGGGTGGSSMMSGGSGGSYYGSGYGYSPTGGYGFGSGYGGFGGLSPMTLGTVPLTTPGGTTYVTGGGTGTGTTGTGTGTTGTGTGTTVIGGAGGGTTFLGGIPGLSGIFDSLFGPTTSSGIASVSPHDIGPTSIVDGIEVTAEGIPVDAFTEGALDTYDGIEGVTSAVQSYVGGGLTPSAAASFVGSGTTGAELFLDPTNTIFSGTPVSTVFSGGSAPLIPGSGTIHAGVGLEGMGFPTGGAEFVSTAPLDYIPGGGIAEGATAATGTGGVASAGGTASAASGGLMAGFSWMTAAAMLAPIIIATIKTDRAGDDKRITGILDSAKRAIAGGATAPTGYTYDAGATDIESMMESTIASEAAGETGKSRTIKLTDDVFGSRVIFTEDDVFHAAAKAVSAGGAPKMGDFGSWDSEPSRETVAAFESATAAYEAKAGPAEVRPSEVGRVISKVTDDAAARMAAGESPYALAEELGLSADKIHMKWVEDYGR